MRGIDIVEEVGPPGKGPKKPADDYEGDSDSEEMDEGGDQEAAEIAAMSEYQHALKNGTAKEALAAYKQLMDTCG